MTHSHPTVWARVGTPWRRDGLLAGLAVSTLALSWYCAAALDHYRAPLHPLREQVSAFDLAFISANAVEPGSTSCAAGECERLAQAGPLNTTL